MWNRFQRIFSENGIQKCVNCSDGYYLTNNNTCELCKQENCKVCSDQCLECMDGYYKKKGENTCSSKCSDKFPHCKKCDYNRCLVCERNYYNAQFGCRHVTDWVPHCAEYGENEKFCARCEKGYELYSELSCLKSNSVYFKLSYIVLFYLFFALF